MTAAINVAAIQITANLNAELGQPIEGAVARFYTPDNSATASNFTPVVTWGDGATSDDATVVVDPAGGFDVQASHTYTDLGQFPLHVDVIDGNSEPLTAEATVNVTQDTLQATGFALSTTQGQFFTSTLATITDPNASRLSDLSAQAIVNGQTTNLTIVNNGNGTFGAIGGFLFTGATNCAVTVNMRDSSGQTAQVTDQVAVTPSTTLTQTFVINAQGQSVSGTLATFIGNASQYNVVINWGDQQTSSVVPVDNSDGSFSVQGTHVYQNPGTYYVAITITDVNSGVQTTANTRINDFAQGTFVWNGSRGNGQWADPGNWTVVGNPGGLNRPPNETDNVVIDAAGATITIGNAVVNSIIQCNATLNVLGNLQLSALSEITGQFNLNGGTLTIAAGTTLKLGGGGNISGTVTMGQGAQLSFLGNANDVPFNIAAGTAFTGTVVVGRGAIVNVNADKNPVLNPAGNPAIDPTTVITTIPNLTIRGGVVNGFGTLNVPNLDWDTGTLAGSAQDTADFFLVNVNVNMKIWVIRKVLQHNIERIYLSANWDRLTLCPACSEPFLSVRPLFLPGAP